MSQEYRQGQECSPLAEHLLEVMQELQRFQVFRSASEGLSRYQWERRDDEARELADRIISGEY